MHLIDVEGDIVPCSYDQGTDCVVIKLHEFDEDFDFCTFVCDGEEYDVRDWDVFRYTRRSVFVTLDIDGGTDSEDLSSEDEYSEDLSDDESSEYSESSEDHLSESESQDGSLNDMPMEYGMPFQ